MSFSNALKEGFSSKLSEKMASLGGMEGGGDGAVQKKPSALVPSPAKEARNQSAEFFQDPANEDPAHAQVRVVKAPPAAKKATGKPGKKKDSLKSRRAAWLQSGGGSGHQVNPQQYVRELERFEADQNRKRSRETLLNVASTEIQGVAAQAARIRGRYLAKLLDAGSPNKSGIHEAELRELSRYRELYEELNKGMDILKAAIESGEIKIDGMSGR